MELGIVAFSFALRDEDQEPNPCNIRLGKAVERIIDAEPAEVVVVSQWEISRQLHIDGRNAAHSVGLLPNGQYLGSEEVWEEAKLLFEQLGITQVIPVAQPFLQIYKIRQMISADGFTVVKRPVGWVGFDRTNNQWWCRGPLQLLIYAVKQKFFGKRGFQGKQPA